MNALFLIIAVVFATLGGVVGWFSRGRLRPTILICVIVPVLVHAVIFLFLLPHEGVVKDKSAVVGLQVMTLLLWTLPCVICGIVMSLAAYYSKHARPFAK